MKLSLLRSRLGNYDRKNITIEPTWYITWGQVNTQPEGCTFFSASKLAIFCTKPTFSPQKGFVVVGDIWLSNRVELLQRLQIQHPTNITDEQLVGMLWEKWGVESVKLLQGMFVLAIWDREREELWLTRDRTGARTLYYTTSGNTRAIAPRLKTLSPFHSRELDTIALRDYLCCAFVPGERTLWQRVKELRPGTILNFPSAKLHHYWQPEEEIKNADKPIEWHADRLRSLLDTVVKEYLPKKEAVGVYLSGGLDSSCVTALAAKFHNYPVHTYSIHFGSDCPNELEFSDRVAKHCHTEHHILEITPQKMWDLLPTTMSHLDDPIGDPLTVPNYLLGQLAKENSTVILNGEGGDPCFGGPKNQPMLLNSLYSETNPDLVSAYLTSFKKCSPDLPRLLKSQVWEEVRKESSIFAADLYSDVRYLNRLMALNIKYKGADHILTKVNNLTRSANLSGRSPLFDQRIVKLAMEIPPEYKVAGAEEKAVLKQAVIDLLPLDIIKRPKSGMMVPVQKWFRQYWQRETRRLLLNKRAAIAPYLDRDLIREWINYRGDVWHRYGVKLWLLVSLEIWLQVN